MNVVPGRLPLLAPVAVLLAACGGDRARSPVCGFAQVAAPTIIQQRFLGDPRAMLVDAPRGLPGALPARLATETQQTTVALGYDANARLVLEYQGANFPSLYTDPTGHDTTGYGLLVVDDTSQRVEGLLVYDTQRPPAGFARIGTVTGGSYTMPVYGVRLNWADVNNPRCPLLGAPVPAASAK